MWLRKWFQRRKFIFVNAFQFGLPKILYKAPKLSSLMCPYFRQSELRTPFDSTQYQWLKYGHISDTTMSVCVRMSVVSVFQSHPNYFVGNSWKLARGSCKKRPTSHSQTDQRRNNHGWYSKFPNELKGLFSCHPHILHCCQYPRGRCQVSNIQLDHFRDSFETIHWNVLTCNNFIPINIIFKNLINHFSRFYANFGIFITKIIPRRPDIDIIFVLQYPMNSTFENGFATTFGGCT